jgi:hypothetical protein
MGDALKNMSVYLSNLIALLETHGGLPRGDITYTWPSDISLSKCIRFGVGDATQLFRWALVVTPLKPVLQFVATSTTSLVACQYAGLCALGRQDVAPLQHLANTQYLAMTSAILRMLIKGQNPGYGAPSSSLCSKLGTSPAAAIPAPPTMVAQILGLPVQSSDMLVLQVPPLAHAVRRDRGTPAGRAELYAQACKATHMVIPCNSRGCHATFFCTRIWRARATTVHRRWEGMRKHQSLVPSWWMLH